MELSAKTSHPLGEVLLHFFRLGTCEWCICGFCFIAAGLVVDSVKVQGNLDITPQSPLERVLVVLQTTVEMQTSCFTLSLEFCLLLFVFACPFVRNWEKCFLR